MAETSLHNPHTLFRALASRLADQPSWLGRIEDCLCAEGSTCARMHLGVFREPFLTMLLKGKKTIESRFSVNRVPPYRAIARNDLILLKRSAGPIVGIALVGDPGFYELDQAAWNLIRSRFAAAMGASDDRFWEQRSAARYGTLIPVRATTTVTPFTVDKRDRRGWVIIAPGQEERT